MGFSKVTATWFSVLGGESKAAKLQVDSMDTVIDAMEQGFARTLARDKVKPETEGAKKRKMNVVRSEDRLRYVLQDEDRTPILEARVTAQGIQVFAAGEDRKMPVDIAAFTLTHDKERKNWQLASSHCDKCAYANPFNSCKNQGGQKLAFVKHAKEEIGEGVAMCMDVDIPQIGEDGQGQVWCPVCAGADDARIELNSVRPKWNAKLKSLCMDFKGRVEAASAKNFQLCLGDDQVVLMYGKKANGTFCLEFEHPLSPVQAFSIALTTMYWT
jgi:hypothetical protein